MKKLCIIGCILLSCLWLQDNAHASSQILSSFNFNDEGWTAECADITYVASGGNPGGHIRIVDNCYASVAAYTPAKFHGDLSQFDGGFIAFDVRSLYPIDTVGSGFGNIQMNAAPPYNATFRGFRNYPKLFSNTEWTTYYIPFTVEAWEVGGDSQKSTLENWQTVIRNVNTIHITLGDVEFDNFRIVKGITSTFDINDEGWSAQGAALSYVSDGTLTGGWITLTDNAGDSFIVLPPSKFLGNLSQYRNGMLSYTVKSLDGSALTSVGSGFGRITIEGAGHQAMLDYAPYPDIPSNVYWTPYYVPMTADAWNVTEQVWQAILAGVTDMNIVLDGAGDVIGLDDFTIEFPKTGPAELWVGLASNADQGNQFDLRVEVYLNGLLVSDGEQSCISGLTATPTKLKVPVTSIESDLPSMAALSMKVLTRMGTNVNGQSCSAISTTSGLRLYYGGTNYPSKISLPEDLYLDLYGKKSVLDNAPPTGVDLYKDSSKLSASKGNPWKVIGTWKMTLP